jgi:hypothetical protein
VTWSRVKYSADGIEPLLAQGRQHLCREGYETWSQPLGGLVHLPNKVGPCWGGTWAGAHFTPLPMLATFGLGCGSPLHF